VEPVPLTSLCDETVFFDTFLNGKGCAADTSPWGPRGPFNNHGPVMNQKNFISRFFLKLAV
jgi:hypothetical protein